jgi:hypothetical protein
MVAREVNCIKKWGTSSDDAEEGCNLLVYRFAVPVKCVSDIGAFFKKIADARSSSKGRPRRKTLRAEAMV